MSFQTGSAWSRGLLTAPIRLTAAAALLGGGTAWGR